MNAQEQLWSGAFGDDYAARNVGRVESNTFFFSRALRNAPGIKSYVEFGAGTGENVAALQRLMSDSRGYAVEINDAAADKIPTGVEVIRDSMLNMSGRLVNMCDLSFTKGVLIHIAPDNLRDAYRALYNASRRYILICEYYSQKPVAVEYRGQTDALWKRDFAGEMLGLYPHLKLRDYGFCYHLDEWPQDDISWFLMEKR